VADLYREIVRLRERGEPCALCTIVQTNGSTPGKEMMKMLVRADGSFAGTVGGGCLEAEVLEAALESLVDERPRTLAFALNERDYPDSGLLCGGRLEIFVEPIVEPRLFLFGGGHVSGAIARVARTVGFQVTVGDDRRAFAEPEAHPDAHAVVCAPFEELARGVGPGEGHYVVVATRGHDQDDALHDGHRLREVAGRQRSPHPRRDQARPDEEVAHGADRQCPRADELGDVAAQHEDEACQFPRSCPADADLRWLNVSSPAQQRVHHRSTE